VLLVVANRIAPAQLDDVEALLRSQLPAEVLLSVIPEDANLLHPTMREIKDGLGAKLLFGEAGLSNQVDNYVIGAMQVPNFLNYLKENVLIVTPGDRGDIIVCALQANQSASYPKVAGIVLSTGSEPDEPVRRLLEGLPNVVPILVVPTGTFETTNRVGAIKSRITPDNPKKIQLAISTFERYVAVRALEEKLALRRTCSSTGSCSGPSASAATSCCLRATTTASCERPRCCCIRISWTSPSWATLTRWRLRPNAWASTCP
jgi:phosphate acetyltransferase